MTKWSTGLFAAALLIGLGCLPTLTNAQEGTAEEAGKGSDSTGNAAEEETFLEKLEDDLKETTTPTDAETDAIGTGEDADRDLY